MKDEEKKISKNREKKQEIIGELSEKFGKAKAMVFANYQGMTHKQLEELKKALKTAEAELVIAKNSLIHRSIPDFKDQRLEGPTATVFAYNDIVAPLKELAKLIKTLKLPVIKFGILDGKALTDTEVLKLATLPSREVLLAQLVGGMKSPLYGLHRALNWNVQKLVMTLSAIQQKKS